MGFVTRIARAARLGRRDRYQKKEQLFIVAISHAVLCVGVITIMASTFRGAARESAPRGFWITELGIVAACLLALVEWNVAGNVLDRYVPRDLLIKLLGRFRAARLGDAVRGLLILMVSFAQFFALGSLLHATGGAIDSPFAQLALAIAIFTPFIANNWGTILFVVGVTMIFYVTLVVTDGFVAQDAPRPSTGAYIAINLLILVVATGLTLGELARGERMAASSPPPRLGDVLGADQPAG
jgi:hypothetical protein